MLASVSRIKLLLKSGYDSTGGVIKQVFKWSKAHSHSAVQWYGTSFFARAYKGCAILANPLKGGDMEKFILSLLCKYLAWVAHDTIFKIFEIR